MNKNIHKIKFKQFNNSKSLNEITLFLNFSYISTKENEKIKINKSNSEKNKNIIKFDNIEIKDINSSFTSKSFLNEVKKYLGNENLNKSEIEILKKNLDKGLNKNKSFQASLKKNLCLSLNSYNYYPFSQKITIKNKFNGTSGLDLSKTNNERNKKALLDKIKKSKKLYINKNKGNSKQEKIQIKKFNNNSSSKKLNKNEDKKKLKKSILNKTKTNEQNENNKSLLSNQLYKIRKKNLTNKLNNNKLNNEDEDLSRLRTNSKTGNLKTKTSLIHNSLTREQSEGKKNKKKHKSSTSLMCNDIINESNEINFSPKKSKKKFGIKLIKKPLHKQLPFINSNSNNKNLFLNQNENKKKHYSLNNSFLVSSNKNKFEKKKFYNKMNQGLNFGYEYWKENQLRLNQILKEKISNIKILSNSMSQPLLFNSTNNEFGNYKRNLISVDRKCKLNEMDCLMNINVNSALNWTDRILGNNFGKTLSDNRNFNRRILKFDMIHRKKFDNLNQFINQNQNQESIIQNYPSIFTYFKE